MRKGIKRSFGLVVSVAFLCVLLGLIPALMLSAVSGAEESFQELKLVKTLKTYKAPVYGIVLSPDGRWLASGSRDGSGDLWEVGSLKIAWPITGHTGYLNSLVFTPDSKYLVSVSGNPENMPFDKPGANVAKIWNLATGKEIRELQGPKAPNPSHVATGTVGISPDGKLIATAGWDNTAQLWEFHTGKQLRVMQGKDHWVNSLRFSADGKFLLSSNGDCWEVASGKTVSVPSSEKWGVLSPNGKIRAGEEAMPIGHDRCVVLSDSASGKELRRLEKHTHYISSIAFRPDGQILVTCSIDGSWKLWDVETGKLLQTMSVPKCDILCGTCFTADNKFLIVGGGDGTVTLWGTTAGQ